MSNRSTAPRRRLVDLGGGQPAIEIVECGDAAGIPVLFFHGWPSAASQCEVFDGAARAAGVRVVAANRPGIGLSAPDPLHTIVGWAGTIGNLATALHIERFRVLGVSGGGPYALSVAWRLPHRVVACAVVSEVPPVGPEGRGLSAWTRCGFTIKRLSPRLAAAMLTAVRVVVRRPALARAVHSRLILRSRREAYALRQRPAGEVSFGAFCEAIDSGAAAVLADSDPYTKPWGFRASEIAVPVCFWHGRLDHTARWDLVSPLAQSIAGARVVLDEHDGHHAMSMLRQDEILGWLLGEHATEAL
jgi:pimeloyl-ACP methyl ester carboxylesterase